MPVTTSLTEQRRRIFEDQDQTIKDRSSSHRRSVRIIEQRSFCARKKLLRLIIHFRSPWVNNCFIFLECQRVHVSGFAFVFFSLSLSALLRTNQNGGRSQINWHKRLSFCQSHPSLQRQVTSNNVVPPRRVHRISGRRRSYLVCISITFQQTHTHSVMVSFCFVFGVFLFIDHILSKITSTDLIIFNDEWKAKGQRM